MSEKNSYKNSNERRKIIVFFLVCAIIVIITFAVSCFVINEFTIETKITNAENQLKNQQVDTICVETISEDKKENFANTMYQSANGYIQTNDALIKIPFFSDSYHSELIYKGYVYIDKFNFEEADFYDTDSISIRGEDYGITIFIHHISYHDEIIDLVSVNEYNYKTIKRLNNIQLGDIVFECYQCDDEVTLIANPYPDLFIEYRICFYRIVDAETITAEFANLMRDIEIIIE